MLVCAVKDFKVLKVLDDFTPLRGKQKKGKRLISHRYDRIPLLDSSPGGVLRELVV